MSKPALSFKEFAAAARRVYCTTCTLPEKLRAEIEQARKDGGSYGQIATWLATHREHRISEGSIRKHFVNGHVR